MTLGADGAILARGGSLVVAGVECFPDPPHAATPIASTSAARHRQMLIAASIIRPRVTAVHYAVTIAREKGGTAGLPSARWQPARIERHTSSIGW